MTPIRIIFRDGTIQEIDWEKVQAVIPADAEVTIEPMDEEEVQEEVVEVVEGAIVPEAVPIPLAPLETPEPVTILLTSNDTIEEIKQAVEEICEPIQIEDEVNEEKPVSVLGHIVESVTVPARTESTEVAEEVCQDNEIVADKTIDNSVLQHIVKAVTVEPVNVRNMDEAIKVVSEGGTAVIETEEVTVEVSPSVPDEELSTEFVQV